MNELNGIREMEEKPDKNKMFYNEYKKTYRFTTDKTKDDNNR